MRRAISWFCILLTLPVFCSISTEGSTLNLNNASKRNLKLPDRDFYQELTVAPDGSIFIAHKLEHYVSKFNSRDVFIKKIPEQDQDATKLLFPGNPSFLKYNDIQYLMLGELPDSRRLKLFTLNGKFYRKIETEQPPYYSVPLESNRIAYLSWTLINENGILKRDTTVRIKNIDTGEEKEVASFKVVDTCNINLAHKAGVFIDAYYRGDVFICSTHEGNLLVGVSNQPVIDVYLPSGEKLRSFILNINPIPVTEEFKRKFQEKHIKEYDKRGENWQRFKGTFIEKIKEDRFFDEYLPYYRNIEVDDDGEIWVFLEKENFESNKETAQIYSSIGVYQNEIYIDPGEFDFNFEKLRKCNRLVFRKGYLYGLLGIKGNEEDLRVIKIKIDKI